MHPTLPLSGRHRNSANRVTAAMNTEIQIDGTRFLINGRPTYEGVTYRGKPVEGLLLNSGMVQAIFDDENPETAGHWRYPDTGLWDPDRNTDEFCAVLPLYRQHGLPSILNQKGIPR